MHEGYRALPSCNIYNSDAVTGYTQEQKNKNSKTGPLSTAHIGLMRDEEQIFTPHHGDKRPCPQG